MSSLLLHAPRFLKHLSGVLALPSHDAKRVPMVPVVVATTNAQRLVSWQTTNPVYVYLNVFSLRVEPLVTAVRHEDDQF
jgi:hypothetical protein